MEKEDIKKAIREENRENFAKGCGCVLLVLLVLGIAIAIL